MMSRLDSTMSTSDWTASDAGRFPLDPASLDPALTVRPDAGFLPGGLFDPGALARMANEFFRATPAPAHAAPDSVPVDTAASSSAPASAPAAPPEISLPSDPHFSGLPASAGPAAVAPVAT